MERLNLKSKLKQLFPVFEQHELVEKIANNCQYFKLPGGTELMHTGSYISVVPLVLSGSIKVFREDADGREIFLYPFIRIILLGLSLFFQLLVNVLMKS